MALTGRADGPALLSCGTPAVIARRAATEFEQLTGVAVDGPALLGERAALMGLTRAGSLSCGGGTRLLRAADNWWALNLARDADVVPALVQEDPGDDVWEAVRRWAATRPVAEIVERTTLLGLAAAALGQTSTAGAAATVERAPAESGNGGRPRVVCLGALWAAPLAANLLALAGAEVLHVESSARPDPTRDSSPSFYELLHRKSATSTVDFGDVDTLANIVRTADIVVEASRPRALRGLGIAAEDVLADGRARTWLRIRAHADPHRIGFGDDAAVAGGLVAWDGDVPVFAADAIADPLTGLLGAVAVAREHRADRSAVIDVRMAEVAALCARGEAAGHSRPDKQIADAVEPASPRAADRVVISARWG
jgi:hypothetical protein